MNFDLYPSEDVQKIWIKAYLEESSGEANNVLDTCSYSSITHSSLLLSEFVMLLTGGTVSPSEVHELYREVNKFALVRS